MKHPTKARKTSSYKAELRRDLKRLRRDERRFRRSLENHPSAWQASRQREQAERELREHFKRSLDVLPLAARQLFVLHVANSSNALIAQRLNVKAGQIRGAIARASAKVHEKVTGWAPSVYPANVEVLHSPISSPSALFKRDLLNGVREGDLSDLDLSEDVSDIDPDIVLVADYFAGELTQRKAAAVESAVVYRYAFFEKVGLYMESMLLQSPIAFRELRARLAERHDHVRQTLVIIRMEGPSPSELTERRADEMFPPRDSAEYGYQYGYE